LDLKYKSFEAKQKTKRKRTRTKKKEKGSHWADPGIGPAQQPPNQPSRPHPATPFLTLSFSFSFSFLPS
jgi:hypothetical protein